MKYTVKASSFVKRQIKSSGKTYSNTISFDEIALIAEQRLNENKYKVGYREGVVIITLNSKLATQFICPLVKINKDTELIARMVKRRDEEDPYIQIRALNGLDLNTDTVDLILYRNDVLAETNENSTDADWELIAFMAKPKDIKMPMGPVTMMRNQLERKGGTKGMYESDEWAHSVEFWQKYAIKEQ
tara:strand:- start:35 stop:595 length:561 start_codon:yes stop_codon:yes gene_type:complete